MRRTAISPLPWNPCHSSLYQPRRFRRWLISPTPCSPPRLLLQKAAAHLNDDTNSSASGRWPSFCTCALNENIRTAISPFSTERPATVAMRMLATPHTRRFRRQNAQRVTPRIAPTAISPFMYSTSVIIFDYVVTRPKGSMGQHSLGS